MPVEQDALNRIFFAWSRTLNDRALGAGKEPVGMVKGDPIGSCFNMSKNRLSKKSRIRTYLDLKDVGPIIRFNEHNLILVANI